MKRAVMLFALCACSKAPSGLDAGFVDMGTGVGMDMGAMPADAGLLRFVAEPTSGPAVDLVQEDLSENQLRLTIVAQQLERLHGVSFRVVYDPEAFNAPVLTAGNTFADGLFKAELVQPGLMVVALSAIGRSSGRDLDGAPLAVLTLTRAQAITGAQVQLRRGLALDVDGRPIQAAFGRGVVQH